MTLTEISHQLQQAGSQTPGLDARLLIGLVTSYDPNQVLTGDWRLTRREQQQLERLIQARSCQPLAYLTGEREFYGQTFLVDSRVLVPRPASEDLVDLALSLGPHSAVYDIGCGSGCLGLAYQLNQADPGPLYLVDNSGAALAVAKRNAQRLGCPANFWPTSIAALSPSDWQTGSLLLANLPYLDEQKKPAYYRRCPDLAAEPVEALFTGRQGLQLYRQLWQRLGSRPSHLVLEADWEQHPKLIAWASQAGWRLTTYRGRALAFVGPRG